MQVQLVPNLTAPFSSKKTLHATKSSCSHQAASAWGNLAAVRCLAGDRFHCFSIIEADRILIKFSRRRNACGPQLYGTSPNTLITYSGAPYEWHDFSRLRNSCVRGMLSACPELTKKGSRLSCVGWAVTVDAEGEPRLLK